MICLRFGLIVGLISICVAYEVFHLSHPNGDYRLSYEQAQALCSKNNAHLATRDELEEMRRANYSNCNCGWVLDKTAYFPMTSSVRGCAGRPGLHKCNWSSRWNAYCFKGDHIGNCSKALGIESGEIQNYQMYASSEYKSRFPFIGNRVWRARIARLHNTRLVNAWTPISDSRIEWLEVDLLKQTAVTGIVTQGASRLGTKMWVVSFMIKHSKDGENFEAIEVDERDKIFEGNEDNDGLKRNMFPEPVLARYIRFIPFNYHNHVAVRLELLGCDMQTYSSGMNESMESNGQTDVFQERPPK